LTVAGQVNEDETCLIGKRRDLFAPKTEIARPAMHKDNDVLAFALDDVMNSICAEFCEMGFGSGKGLGRFAIFGRAGATGNQQESRGRNYATKGSNHNRSVVGDPWIPKDASQRKQCITSPDGSNQYLRSRE